MSNTEIIIVAVGLLIVAGIVWWIKAVVIPHNKAVLNAIATMPTEIKNHMTAMTGMVNNSVKNTDAKIEQLIKNTSANLDAKKQEVKDFLSKKISEL